MSTVVNSYFKLKRFLGLLASMLIWVSIALFFNYQFGTPIKVFEYIAAFVAIAALTIQFWLAKRIRNTVQTASNNYVGVNIKQYKDPLWLRLVLMVIMIGWIALLGYSFIAHKSILGALGIGLGTLSFWAAPHYLVSKQPILAFGGLIKYEIEPGKYKSSIAAQIVIGMLFIYYGADLFAGHW